MTVNMNPESVCGVPVDCCEEHIPEALNVSLSGCFVRDVQVAWVSGNSFEGADGFVLGGKPARVLITLTCATGTWLIGVALDIKTDDVWTRCQTWEGGSAGSEACDPLNIDFGDVTGLLSGCDECQNAVMNIVVTA